MFFSCLVVIFHFPFISFFVVRIIFLTFLISVSISAFFSLPVAFG